VLGTGVPDSLIGKGFEPMLLDPEKGLYVFEVVLGYQNDDDPEYTVPYLVQANDEDEAEGKVQAFLEGLEMDQDFWIEELSDPYLLTEYQHSLNENGDQAHIILEELTEEDLLGLLRA
jgi:hypothetical protein